jgi:hypothetical protein
VPRHAAPTRALIAAEHKRETPGPNQLAKKFGQNKPRPGAAVVRTPAARNTNSRSTVAARPARKATTTSNRGGRK